VELSVRGPAEAPVIESEFRVDGPRYGAMQLTRVDGEMSYRRGELRFDLDGFDGDRTALLANGMFPVDLGLIDVDRRVLDEEMRVDLVADSLDAAIALSYVPALEGVVGSVSGDVSIGGTPADPTPSGRVTLAEGAWSIEAIGVRHTGVNGTLTLRNDRRVDVALSATGNGRSDVTGTVLLEPFSDPLLDLRFAFERFLAVSRPDIAGSVSGGFDLSGRYSLPLAEGSLTVDESAIYVEELQRVAGVVDLNDPFLFESGIAVDTTALVSQPLFGSTSTGPSPGAPGYARSIRTWRCPVIFWFATTGRRATSCWLGSFKLCGAHTECSGARSSWLGEVWSFSGAPA
jgi:hypothetical protein